MKLPEELSTKEMVEQIMQKTGERQAHIALRLGVTPRSVGSWLNDGREPIGIIRRAVEATWRQVML